MRLKIKFNQSYLILNQRYAVNPSEKKVQIFSKKKQNIV